MKKSELILHAAMFDQRLLDKTCTVIVVTLLYGCQISVLSALSLDFIKYKLERSNADSFHHRLAYLPNRKLYPNIRCRCGLDTVFLYLILCEKCMLNNATINGLQCTDVPNLNNLPYDVYRNMPIQRYIRFSSSLLHSSQRLIDAPLTKSWIRPWLSAFRIIGISNGNRTQTWKEVNVVFF